MAKILSAEELEGLNGKLDWLKKDTEIGIHDIEVVINSFNNEEIVNSFYASGNYGENIQETMQQILSAVQRLSSAILDGQDSLYFQTQKYIERQIELTNNGK